MKHEHSQANILAEIRDDDLSSWLEHRKSGIGGTDISAIVGINPWRSALTAYYEKRGELPDLQETERMKWGKLLENVIAEECASRNGLTIHPCPYLLQHPEVPYALASPDRVIIDAERGNGILEVKNIGHWAAQGVRSGLSEIEIPDHYILQVQWYLYVTGLKWGMFAALLEGNELVTRDVIRDDELISHLVKLAGQFWQCVESETPPAADGSESTTETLKTLFPADNELGPVILAPEYLPLFAERAEMKQTEKIAKGRISEIENQIKAAIGSATVAACGGYELSYKEQTRKESITKASTFRVLRIKGE